MKLHAANSLTHASWNISTQLKLRKLKFVSDFDNDSYTLLY